MHIRDGSTRPNVDIGDGEVARRNEILRTEVGSGVHGMAIAGTDDHDETGIYIEEPNQLLGLEATAEHWVSRTQPEGERSGPGDTDLTVYGLRKFLRLAVAGNPTILIPLFANGDSIMMTTTLGDELRALTPSILSIAAGHRFLGYLDGQRERLMGRGRQGRVPNRPELVARHGFDSKYASHALRLGLQGLELTTTGRLSLPLPPDDLASCLAVKKGEVGLNDAMALIDETRAALAEVVLNERSVLPEQPDMERVNNWMVAATRCHWQERGLP